MEKRFHSSLWLNVRSGAMGLRRKYILSRVILCMWGRGGRVLKERKFNLFSRSEPDLPRFLPCREAENFGTIWLR